jgi:hypothetical protein
MVTEIGVTCPVFPSEDGEKVRKAILNVFPDAVLETVDGGFGATLDNMEHFGEQIRRQKILDTARSVMLKGRRGERSVFHLNKQAAYAGKISFTEERTILGTIKVTASADDITAFIETIAPNTVNGEEVMI